MRGEVLPEKAIFVEKPKAGNKGNYMKIWGEHPGRKNSQCKGPETGVGRLEVSRLPPHILLFLHLWSPGL